MDETKLNCGWCGMPGAVIGDAKSFPGTRVAKCTACHHEWETLVEATPDERLKWSRFVQDTIKKFKTTQKV